MNSALTLRRLLSVLLGLAMTVAHAQLAPSVREDTTRLVFLGTTPSTRVLVMLDSAICQANFGVWGGASSLEDPRAEARVK